jgi:predicted secreted protein
MKQPLFGALLLLFTQFLSAGDLASFQNLGFSADGRYFQFGQYGVKQSNQLPYALIDTVDVPRNVFVPNGRFRLNASSASLGDDGRKVLIALLDQSQPLRRRLRIDSLNTGRPIYFRVNGVDAESKNVQFIDYQTNLNFELKLVQTVVGQGRETRSRFHIDVTIKDANGRVVNTLRMGTPQFERQGIRDYRIAQVILGPTEKQLVIVVERDEWAGRVQSGDDWNVRYMVETAVLP